MEFPKTFSSRADSKITQQGLLEFLTQLGADTRQASQNLDLMSKADIPLGEVTIEAKKDKTTKATLVGVRGKIVLRESVKLKGTSRAAPIPYKNSPRTHVRIYHSQAKTYLSLYNAIEEVLDAQGST